MTKLDVDIEPQPTVTTCGPTALHAVYRYWCDDISLDRVIDETGSLEEGGTLAVMLGVHALRRGYAAELYSFNISLLDPTWFDGDAVDIRAKLAEQAALKSSKKLTVASQAYVSFLEHGGVLRMEDLTLDVLRRHLVAGCPVLTGVSGTYLYHCARELDDGRHDDLRGDPQGHFVVVTGATADQVMLADPWPVDGKAGRYTIDVARFINAALLGVITYDGNLLVLKPKQDD